MKGSLNIVFTPSKKDEDFLVIIIDSHERGGNPDIYTFYRNLFNKLGFKAKSDKAEKIILRGYKRWYIKLVEYINKKNKEADGKRPFININKVEEKIGKIPKEVREDEDGYVKISQKQEKGEDFIVVKVSLEIKKPFKDLEYLVYDRDDNVYLPCSYVSLEKDADGIPILLLLENHRKEVYICLRIGAYFYHDDKKVKY